MTSSKAKRPNSGDKSTITLNTIALQQIWTTRDEPGKPLIVGTGQFLRRLSNVERALDDDPWAEQIHDEIEDLIDQVRKDLDSLANEISQLVDSTVPNDPRIKIVVDESFLSPKTFEIEATPMLGWKMIRLLLNADDLVVNISKAERSGVLRRRDHREMVREATKPLRRINNHIQKWKYSGITHEALLEDNALAREVREKNGPLDPQYDPAHPSYESE